MARTTAAQSRIITRLMTAHANAIAGVCAQGWPGYSDAEKAKLTEDLIATSAWLDARKPTETKRTVYAAQPALVEAKPASSKPSPKGSSWEARKARVAAKLASPIGRIPAGPGKQTPVKARKAPVKDAPKDAPKAPKGPAKADAMADCRLDTRSHTIRVAQDVVDAGLDIDVAGCYIVTRDAEYVTVRGSQAALKSIMKAHKTTMEV